MLKFQELTTKSYFSWKLYVYHKLALTLFHVLLRYLGLQGRPNLEHYQSHVENVNQS